MRCLEFMKIVEILRLYEMRIFTMREIGASVGCSKTTVSEILARCRECGLSYEDAKDMSQSRINELIYPDSFGRKMVKEEPDWESIHKALQSSRRMNLQYIWEEIEKPENRPAVYCRHYIVPVYQLILYFRGRFSRLLSTTTRPADYIKLLCCGCKKPQNRPLVFIAHIPNSFTGLR